MKRIPALVLLVASSAAFPALANYDRVPSLRTMAAPIYDSVQPLKPPVVYDRVPPASQYQKAPGPPVGVYGPLPRLSASGQSAALESKRSTQGSLDLKGVDRGLATWIEAARKQRVAEGTVLERIPLERRGALGDRYEKAVAELRAQVLTLTTLRREINRFPENRALQVKTFQQLGDMGMRAVELRKEVSASKVAAVNRLAQTAGGNRVVASRVFALGVERTVNMAIQNRQVVLEVLARKGADRKLSKAERQQRDRLSKEVKGLEKSKAKYQQLRQAFGGAPGWQGANDKVKVAHAEAVRMLGAASGSWSSNSSMAGDGRGAKAAASASKSLQKSFKVFEKASKRATKSAPKKPKPKKKGK